MRREEMDQLGVVTQESLVILLLSRSGQGPHILPETAVAHSTRSNWLRSPDAGWQSEVKRETLAVISQSYYSTLINPLPPVLWSHRVQRVKLSVNSVTVKNRNTPDWKWHTVYLKIAVLSMRWISFCRAFLFKLECILSKKEKILSDKKLN